jgi:hypothetical protein
MLPPPSPVRRGQTRRFALVFALLVLLGLLLSWVLVDRALAGLPPSSVVRDALQARAPVLAAPLQWLKPAASPLDVTALMAWRPAPVAAGLSSMQVRDVDGLRAAMAAAQAGDVIELAAGDYLIDEALETAAGGQAQAPIIVRGAAGARLLVRAALGLRVSQPWWVLEGLVVEGRCPPPGCDLALLVQGSARQLRLQQLTLRNFTTAIRVRGSEGNWPDHGSVRDSLFLNEAPAGAAAVRTLDLLGASHWRFEGNRVFGVGRGQAQGGGTAYALRLRGGGEGNQIERNLIVCAPGETFRSGVGPQVAIGLGSGGTSGRQRRDPSQGLEQQRGRVAHNLIANCSDVAVDIHRSADIQLLHNNLLSSGGIALRGPGASAELVANLTSGAWYPRRGTLLIGGRNLRWRPQSGEVLAALREARAVVPKPADGEQAAGADTRWLLP